MERPALHSHQQAHDRRYIFRNELVLRDIRTHSRHVRGMHTHVERPALHGHQQAHARRYFVHELVLNKIHKQNALTKFMN